MSEPTDAELKEKLDRLRQEFMARGAFDLPAEEPVLKDAPDEKRPEPTTKQIARVEQEWEPQCVSCGVPLGYRCRVGTYRSIRLCGQCGKQAADVRLASSGISEIELHEPLSALKPHGSDGKPYGENWTKYMKFLLRFATLRPGETMRPPFAFVYGSNGVGKTAGAERALRDAIVNGCSGRSMRLSSILDAIYSGYGNGDADERMRFFSTIHLLVVQEVGMQTATEHAWSRFFDLVDDRLRSALPTIFTSNYSPEKDSLGVKVDDSVVMRGLLSRIEGGARENIFRIIGASWRTLR